MLSQLGALLGSVMDDENTSLDIQAAFVDQMKFAMTGMTAWDNLETLVYETCDIYPVCSCVPHTK